ncbi:hypothetical protein LOTGIDRAFT_162005 [Lottia gigantea]|uniref:Uncharacterized protein n=1 Tax=Lottia gigantea TaxID=225164 RepID=V3ZNN1_LOTGI|nr:hypothetical protein LOTGIDRAFT_162005 [Lottia gigantea]ESO92978.1 hypothetical protein LOTGIDRAFT_162005 [Lottia gigantea]
MGLLAYRTTPLKHIELSPSELLMNRNLRTNLPIKTDLLNVPNSKNVVKKREELRENQKLYYDKNSTRSLRSLEPGNIVRVINCNNNTWSNKGTIIRLVAPRSYLVKLDNDVLFRRNRKDLLLIPNSMHNISNENEDISHTDIHTLDRPKRHTRPPDRLLENC